MRNILIIFLLLSCQKDGDCIKGAYTKGTTCIEIYEPVCTPDGTIYMNSCYAEKDGWDSSCINNC